MKNKNKYLMIFFMVVAASLMLNVAVAQQSDLFDDALLVLLPSVNISQENSTALQNGDPQGAGIQFDTTNFQLGNAALGFEGGVNDYILYTDQARYNEMEDFSLVAWHNDSAPSGDSLQLIGTRTAGGANGEFWMGVISTGSLTCQYDSDLGANVGFTTGFAAQNGTWYMAVCLFDFNQAGIANVTGFINTTQIATSGNQASNYVSVNRDIQIGYDGFDTLKGGLNGVYIINKSLTQAELEELHTAGSAGQILSASVAVDNNISTSVKVFLNGTQQNIVVLSNQLFNVSYEEVNGTATFTRNGTPVLNNSQQSLGVGTFIFNATILQTDSIFRSSQSFISTVVEGPAAPTRGDTLTGFSEDAGPPLIEMAVFILVLFVFIAGFAGVFKGGKK